MIKIALKLLCIISIWFILHNTKDNRRYLVVIAIFVLLLSERVIFTMETVECVVDKVEDIVIEVVTKDYLYKQL